MDKPTPEFPSDADRLLGEAFSGLPDDLGKFADLFEKKVRPALIAKEGQRLEAAAQARNWTLVAVALGIFGSVGAYAIFASAPLAIVGVVLGVMIHGFGRLPLNRIGRDAKILIMREITSGLGMTYRERPAHPATIEAIHDAKLVGSWDRAKFEDQLTGRRRGADFELFEAHLEQRRQTTDSKGRTRTRWVTIFKGQCLRFDFHKAFYGETLVARDAGLFNLFSGKRGLERARLEDPEFEKIFQVFTTDQVEARFLLTPDLMQRFVDLESTLHGKDMRCAFVDGEVLLVMEGGNLFEPGSLFTPLDNPERMRDMLDDLTAVFHVMDQITQGRRTEESERKAT